MLVMTQMLQRAQASVEAVFLLLFQSINLYEGVQDEFIRCFSSLTVDKGLSLKMNFVFRKFACCSSFLQRGWREGYAGDHSENMKLYPKILNTMIEKIHFPTLLEQKKLRHQNKNVNPNNVPVHAFPFEKA